ncbi:MAG: hypothetical protein J3K34DRAFT_425153 [Monoraphidium minutum]|nr:MAG: hypothetical protein J3K34DRAFT_425153 [Monoraphidium minutum]
MMLQRTARALSWVFHTYDMPEVLLLYGWLGFAFSIGAYTAKQVYFNPEAGSYLNVNLRGDALAQADSAEAWLNDPSRRHHSMWWRVAQVKMDDNGANIGVGPFDNRARPHQYSKPGVAGMGAGVPAA